MNLLASPVPPVGAFILLQGATTECLVFHFLLFGFKNVVPYSIQVIKICFHSSNLQIFAITYFKIAFLVY